MRPAISSLFVILASSGVISAQSITFTPTAGVSSPLSGEMVMWEPIPSMAGFDSIPVRHRYTPGATVGVLAEWNRRAAFGLAAQLSATFSTREIEDPNTPACGDCRSAVYGVGVMATTAREVAGATRLHLAAGPELLMFTGGAVSNEGHALPPYEVEVSPNNVIGALAVFGISRTLSSGSEIRLSLAYRRYSPTHKSTRPDLSPEPNVDEDTFQDLLLTVGFRPRRP